MFKKGADKRLSGQKNMKRNESGTQNNKMMSSKQLKSTYSQYVQKFGKEIQENSSIQNVQKSLSQLRILLKELNIVLNNMVNKSYELMNDKQVVEINPDKQIQILKNKVQNSKKLLQTQQAQMSSLSNTFYDLESKQNYLQNIIQEIIEIKQKITAGSLKSKNNTSDVNRNAYNLVNKEIYNVKQLNRIKNMSTQIEITRQKLKKHEQRLQNLFQKQKQMIKKTQQINIKLEQQIVMARNKQLQITQEGIIISYQQKYQQTLSKKNAQIKKKALIQHVMKSNQESVNKKIYDMRQLLKTYESKEESLKEKINKKSKQIQKLVNDNTSIMSNFTNRSLPLKYIQTMLKGEKAKNNKNQQNDNYDDEFFQDYNGLNNSQVKDKNKNQQVDGNKKQTKFLKPNLMRKKRNTTDLQSFQRSKSIQQIQPKTNKLPSKSFNMEQQNIKAKQFKYASVNQLARNSVTQKRGALVDKSVQSPKVKYWKNENHNQSFNAEQKDASFRQVASLKPNLNIRKKLNQSIAATNEPLPKIANKQQAKQQDDNANVVIAPRFTRLSNKRMNNKANDEYVSYLQDKGKKILGIS